MGRTAIGIVLATVAMYLFGFAYWAANPLPYRAWKQAPDDAAAQAALRSHFPEAGTYFVPTVNQDQASLKERYNAGPIAMVHLVSTEGKEPFDMALMAKGFVLTLITAIVLALLYRQALAPGASYASGIKLALLVGIAAAILIDIGDAVWWMHPLEWKIHKSIYHVGVVVVAGLVLTKFAVPKPAK